MPVTCVMLGARSRESADLNVHLGRSWRGNLAVAFRGREMVVGARWHLRRGFVRMRRRERIKRIAPLSGEISPPGPLSFSCPGEEISALTRIYPVNPVPSVSSVRTLRRRCWRTLRHRYHLGAALRVQIGR